MKTFSRGIAETKKLRQVYLTEYRTEKRWMGDLNTTVKHLLANMRLLTLRTSLARELQSRRAQKRNCSILMLSELVKFEGLLMNATEPTLLKSLLGGGIMLLLNLV